MNTQQRGFTIIEILCTIGIAGVMISTAIFNYRNMTDPLTNATASVEQFLHVVRSQAIASTSVIRIQPSSPTTLSCYTSDSCTDTMTPLTTLSLTLPTGASIVENSWSICFTQRGLASASTSFHVTDTHGQTKFISVALGGGTKSNI